jgi:hypothetical protein
VCLKIEGAVENGGVGTGSGVSQDPLKVGGMRNSPILVTRKAGIAISLPRHKTALAPRVDMEHATDGLHHG